MVTLAEVADREPLVFKALQAAKAKESERQNRPIAAVPEGPSQLRQALEGKDESALDDQIEFQFHVRLCSRLSTSILTTSSSAWPLRGAVTATARRL